MHARPVAPSATVFDSTVRHGFRWLAASPGLRLALLYGIWTALSLLADSLGIVPLPPGAGLVLATGVGLTVGLFLLLGRMPAEDQPAGATMAAAQALMGIIWATLYAYFAAGAAVLAPGMYVTAIAVAIPAVDLQLLRRLMGSAIVAYAAAPLLGKGLDMGAADIKAAAVGGAALAGLMGALYLAARVLANLRANLEARNDEMRASIERITRRAERDHLTNTYNRRSILEMINREKARADRGGEQLCICLLDIDHFKDMNDRFGHLTGDRILAAFARRVRGALRTMDSVNRNGLRSSLGRVGGEEFIVILPHTALRGALRCAERIRKAVIRRPFEGLHHVTVSIGIAEYRPGETVSSLIGRADEALYGAKHAGRNRVHGATLDGGPNAIVMPDIPAAV